MVCPHYSAQCYWRKAGMKVILVISILMLDVILGSGPASGAPAAEAVYVGAGYSHITTGIANLTPQDMPVYSLFKTVGAFTSATDSPNADAWTLYAGYQFNRLFAAELDYLPLGEFTRRANGTGILKPFAATRFNTVESLKLEGLGLAAVATLPVKGKFSVFGKLGGFFWDGKLDSATNFIGIPNTGQPPHGPVAATVEKNGLSPYYGLGGSYQITKRLHLRGEFMQVLNVGGGLTTGQANVNVISIGMQLNF
jgi:hypothetical protein